MLASRQQCTHADAWLPGRPLSPAASRLVRSRNFVQIGPRIPANYGRTPLPPVHPGVLLSKGLNGARRDEGTMRE